MESNRPSIQLESLRSQPRPQSRSSLDSLKEVPCKSSPEGVVQNVFLSNGFDDVDDDDPNPKGARPNKLRTIAFVALALLILAWWLSSTILPSSRPRWIVQTVWAWFFVLTIVFRFVPASVVARPVAALWRPAVAVPVACLPPRARLALAWLAALAITFGSAFGITRPEGTALSDRIISLAGVYFFQFGVWLHSRNRCAVNWVRIPVSIVLQQALALFVLKSAAGFAIFAWISTTVADFESVAIAATAFVFDADTATKGWFFISTLSVLVFVTALVQILYWFGWMQWLTKQFAWLGEHVFAASGAETFVALWSPWFGQANSAVLVGPYVESMTDSELCALMAISMSSISAILIGSYTALGVPVRTLLAQAAITIPASLVNAKVAFPDADASAPATRSRASTHAYRKSLNLPRAHGILESLCDGAWLGLRVAGSVLTNYFALLTLFASANGLFVWIFRGFGVHNFDGTLVSAALLTPAVFFLGVPRAEVWRLSYILADKLVLGPDAGQAALHAARETLSTRGAAVAAVALANTANLASLGIQVGVLAALAPARRAAIGRGAIPALIIAIFTSLQTAAIAASVL